MYIHFSLTVKLTEDENKVDDLFFLCFFNGEQNAWPGINFLQMSNSVLVLQQWTFCMCLVVHGCALWWKMADCSFELWDSYFW